MRTALFCTLAVGAMLSGGCSSGESYVKAGYDFARVDKVAVVGVLGVLKAEASKDEVADLFLTELRKKRYSPLERAEVWSLLKEQKFQASDLTTQEGAARAGQILNVSTVLVVNIPECGEQISMAARMIDVETAGVVWMGSGIASTGGTLSAIFGAFTGGSPGGGAAGSGLSLQEARKAREIVKEMCKSLPSRPGAK